MKKSLPIGLFMLCCARLPEGELTRTLHAPHPKYLDRLSPNARAAVRGSETEKTETKLAAGLPEACLFDSSAPLCLHCEKDGIVVYRCYQHAHPVSAEEDCHHDKEIIKCLVKNPPFALYLDYQNSSERFFLENLKTWIASVHQIWDEQFTPEEKSESERILAGLESIGEIYTARTARDESDNQRFFSAFGLPEGKEAIARGFLGKLDTERQRGLLKVGELTKDYRDLIAKTHGPSPLFEKFMTMSLEGLED